MNKKLGELYNITSGATPSRKKESYYKDGSIKWVKTGDLKSKYLYETYENISEEGFENSSTKMYEPNTVLIAMYGATIGATSILKTNACTNQACAAFTPNNNILPEYLYYFLKSKKNLFIKDGVGGAQPNISAGYLRNIEINLLDIHKQTEIVNKISTIERILTNKQKKVILLDDLIKSRFIEMFGNQSINEKEFNYGKLEDVAEIYLGLTHTPKYTTEGIIFISAKNTSAEFLDLSDVKYISREEFNTAPNGSKPQVGDVLFSRVGSNLGHPVILEESIELCTFVSLGFLRAKTNILNVYLKYWMKDDFFMEQVRRKVVGGGQPNLNTGWLKEFYIIIPPIKLQKQFADFVERVNKSKFFAKQTVEKLKILKERLFNMYDKS